MSTSTASWGSSISHNLRATKGILQCMIFDARIATSLGKTEFDALEQDALDVLLLIRSWRNGVAPINQIPPEILTLIPDFLHVRQGKDGDVIALSQVCRAWREAFTSRSSLWTDLNCMDQDKSEVYLERSKPLPINLFVDREYSPLLHDPFCQIIPLAIGRLRSLTVRATPKSLQNIIAHLSHPAPFVEELSIHGGCDYELHRNPVVTPTLFDGDLSSLRMLCLEYVRTELPWRNMINLTSFVLTNTAPGEVTVEHLLDFFESAPNLRKVDLHNVAPTSSSQNERLVSLPCLKWMWTSDSDPPFPLLDHLLIPAGAHLQTDVERVVLPTGTRPRFLDNLGNLPNFTSIRFVAQYLRMEFSGPNGKVTMNLADSPVGDGCSVFGSLAWLDTSKTERLQFVGADPRPSDLYCVLLPMNDLRTLTLHKCRSPHIPIQALHPGMWSPSEIVVCPKLEELIVHLKSGGEGINIQEVIRTLAARASRGAKLRTVRIIDGHTKPKVDPVDVLELRKHAWCVEYGPEAGMVTRKTEERRL